MPSPDTGIENGTGSRDAPTHHDRSSALVPAARTAGLPVIDGSTRVPYGLEVRTEPYDGSGFIAIKL